MISEEKTLVYRPKMPSAISIFCNPNRYKEQRRCSSQHVDYLDTKVEAAAKDLQPFILMYTLNMLSPVFLLPLTGGHNICPCWSSPSCTQYRTSGAGTVEREKKKKENMEMVLWYMCLWYALHSSQKTNRKTAENAAQPSPIRGRQETLSHIATRHRAWICSF